MRINNNIPSAIRCIKYNLAALVLAVSCYALFSFKAASFNDDVLAVIGINPSQANEKITTGIVNGYVNTWGIKNIKNIAAGNRAAVALDLLAYTKKYVSSADFATAYAAMRESYKPQVSPAPEAPVAYKNKLVEQARQSVNDTQKYYDNASAENKTLFKPALDDARKYLEDIQDPDNELIKMYADNYELMLDAYKKDSVDRSAEWQRQYPENPVLFVQKRLEQFITVTAGIDFTAATVEKNGKIYFADPQLERKDNNWKMAYRSGKEVVETSRTFVQQWLNEIK